MNIKSQNRSTSHEESSLTLPANFTKACSEHEQLLSKCINALDSISPIYFKSDSAGVYRVTVDVGCNKTTGCLLPHIRKQTAQLLQEWRTEFAPKLPKRSSNHPVLRPDGDESVRIVNPPSELESYINSCIIKSKQAGK